MRILQGLAVLHQSGVHFDLKPDNILLDQEKAPVVTDYGTANTYDSLRGIPLLYPPEVFALCKKGIPSKPIIREFQVIHGKARDVWAAGTLCFLILFNRFPTSITKAISPLYSGDDLDPTRVIFKEDEVKAELQSAKQATTDPLVGSMVEVVEPMLHFDPTQRPSIQQCLEKIKLWNV